MWAEVPPNSFEIMNNEFISINLCGVLSHFSPVWLFVTLWTVAHQAPLSMSFSRQGYSSGLPCPPPCDHPDPGINLTSLTSPALAGEFFTSATPYLYVFANEIQGNAAKSCFKFK